MKKTKILLVLGLFVLSPLSSFAQKALSAREFIAEISSLLEQQTSDSDIAKRIEKSHLSESLSRETLESALQGHEIGPFTSLALDVAIFNAAFLPPPQDTVPADAPPDQATVELIKTRLRDYTQNLSDSWSRFSCVHALTWEANHLPSIPGARVFPGSKRWYADAVPTLGNRMETNGPGKVQYGRVLKFTTAELTWDHWETVAGHKAAVLRFKEVGTKAKQPLGGMSLGSISPSRGLVYCSPEDGTIYRVMETQGQNIGVHDGSTVSVIESDFAPVTLSGKTFEFPTRIVTILRVEGLDSWNKLTTVMSNFRE